MNQIITFRPKTNTQRSAVARFAGVQWERTPGHGSMTICGEVCVMVNPVGFRRESRWVGEAEIKSVIQTSDDLRTAERQASPV